jgi:peptidoglycan-associated lipoprotein
MRKSWLVLAAIAFLFTACDSTPDASNTAATDAGTGSTGVVAPPPMGNMAPVGMVGANQLSQDVADRVFFATDSSEIDATAQAALTKQADWLKSRPNLKITIEGHCDERGTREYNLALGERRANAAKDYLVSLGVPASRLNTISYGKERPAVDGHDEAAWAQNRRAVTVVQ